MQPNTLQLTEGLWTGDQSERRADRHHNTYSIQPALSGDGGSVVRPSIARVDESILANGRGKPHPGPISGGGQRTSGAGSTDGGNVGPVGGRNAHGAPRFDQKVVDALSDCGQFGLTIIAFVGSVFSPYYRFASRDKPASADNHCCLNVALYGAAGSLKNRRWTMTERGQSHVSRSATEFVIGPSSVRWDGAALVIDINEVGVPIPFPVKGRVRVIPHGLSNRLWALDQDAKHHWGPIAPSATVEAEFAAPDIRWSGHAYLDANEGTEPINKASDPSFVDWDWSRASLKDGSTAVIYDVRQPNSNRLLALKFSPNADSIENFYAPEKKVLPKTLWRMSRSIRSDEGEIPKVIQTLEDTPFYVRSVLESSLLGEKVTSLHETLSVPKLSAMSTQLMLPWRMPRVG
jgi:carotenoid 1,2-hydratase